MPFVSQQQRKFFYSQLPHLAKKWEAHTPKGKKLPKKVKENGGELQKGGFLLPIIHEKAVGDSFAQDIEKLNKEVKLSEIPTNKLSKVKKVPLPDRVRKQAENSKELKNYAIIDKNNDSAYYFNPRNELITGEPVITGKSGNNVDYGLSMKEFFEKTGTEDHEAYFKYLEDNKFQTTPSGRFRISSLRENTAENPDIKGRLWNDLFNSERAEKIKNNRLRDYGAQQKMFTLVSENGVPSSKAIHGTLNPVRVDAFKNNKPGFSTNRKLSNGCINVNGESICFDTLEKGSGIFVLPQGSDEILEKTNLGITKNLSKEYVKTKKEIAQTLADKKLPVTDEAVNYISAIAEKETENGRNLLSKAENLMPFFSQTTGDFQINPKTFSKYLPKGYSGSKEDQVQAVYNFYNAPENKGKSIEESYPQYAGAKTKDEVYGKEIRKKFNRLQGVYKKGGFKLNPENKGDCTPMTKSTCTGKKRQFAINAKKHFKKHEEGGFSITGYLPISKDKNRPFNIIPSPDITMKTVPHPVMGISQETGEEKLMMPGEEHHFENTENVLEIPVKQSGGRLVDKVPEGYTPMPNRPNYYHKKSAIALAQAQVSGKDRGGIEYEQYLQKQLANGVTPDELVTKKYISSDAVGKYQQYYKPLEDIVYTESKPVVPDYPALSNRKQPVMDGNKHLTGYFDWQARDSKGVSDGGRVNEADRDAIFYYADGYGKPDPSRGVYRVPGDVWSNTFTGTDNILKQSDKLNKYAINSTVKRKSGGLVKPLQVGGIVPQVERDLSFLPAVANSVAQALATRVDNARKDNLISSQLTNPLNVIPQTINSNDYVNYGTPQFQEGGEIEEKDFSDEDFIFDEATVTTQTQPEEQEEVSTPVIEEVEEEGIAYDESTIEEDEDEAHAKLEPPIYSKLSSMVLRNTENLDNQIAAVESGGDYRAENPNSSAVGKYQFLWGSWGNEIKRVTGVTSKQEFKNSPEAQEQYYSYYKNKHLLPAAEQLQSVNSGLTFNQLAKLVHFKGAAGAKKYLTRGIDDTRKNNISIPKYLGKS